MNKLSLLKRLLLSKLRLQSPEAPQEIKRAEFDVKTYYEIIITDGLNHLLPLSSMTIVDDMKDVVSVGLDISRIECSVKIIGAKDGKSIVLLNVPHTTRVRHKVELKKYDLVRIVLQSKDRSRTSLKIAKITDKG